MMSVPETKLRISWDGSHEKGSNLIRFQQDGVAIGFQSRRGVNLNGVSSTEASVRCVCDYFVSAQNFAAHQFLFTALQGLKTASQPIIFHATWSRIWRAGMGTSRIKEWKREIWRVQGFWEGFLWLELESRNLTEFSEIWQNSLTQTPAVVCGNCEWSISENGCLSSLGSEYCGANCTTIDMRNKGISSIDSDAFKGNGHVKEL